MDGSESIRYRETRTTSENDYELWHPIGLSLSCFVAATVVVSWLFQPGRAYWDQLDLAVFRRLNGTLEWGNSAWNSVWAVANWRPFDVVMGLILLVLVFSAIRWQFRGRPFHAIASLLILCLATLAMTKIGSDMLVIEKFQYRRGSPTHVLADTNRLNAMVDWVECKDISPKSFPGDHGFILLMVAFYVTYIGRKRTALVAWCFALLFLVPRLISGAHWFTDIAVGSLSMALVTSAIIFATPLHDYVLSFVPAGKLLANFSEVAAESVAAPVQRVATAAPQVVRRTTVG